MKKLMEGKICLVTGANSGIGKELTTALAEYGATVIMICRDRTRGEIVRNEIQEKTHNQNIDLIIVDISSQQSIREGIHEFNTKYNRLDILVNNAGVLLFDRILSKDGIEKTLATNFLGPYILTNLLLDSLKNAVPSRIINVVSEGATNGIMNIESIMDKEKYKPVIAYSQSKQAEILFTFELANRLEGSGITTNCFYPGLVNTRLGYSEKGFRKLTRFVITKLLKSMFVPIHESITVGLFLAVSQKASLLNGAYVMKKKNRMVFTKKYDHEAAIKIWKIAEKLTGLAYSIP